MGKFFVPPKDIRSTDARLWVEREVLQTVKFLYDAYEEAKRRARVASFAPYEPKLTVRRLQEILDEDGNRPREWRISVKASKINLVRSVVYDLVQRGELTVSMPEQERDPGDARTYSPKVK